MIVPWLKGFISWIHAPLAWTLIAVNFFIFFLTYQPAQPGFGKVFSKTEKLETLGHLYHQFKNQPHSSDSKKLLVDGMQALRDPEFIKTFDKKEFTGDQIAISEIKAELIEFRDNFETRGARIFGLSTDKKSIFSWITYQFMHAGWIHLLSNMMLLLIFAGALEVQVGGLTLLVIYLLGGIGGGIGFYFLGISSIAPMIGASGSLSAVMAFYALYEKKKRVSFFYFLSPFEGYYGWLYLPTLAIFPLCFLADLASYMSTAPELGAGVAYTAHLGGAASGAVMAVIVRLLERNLGASYFRKHIGAP